MKLDLADLQGVFGFGVAGNFAGHLEQAGEAGDFSSVAAEPEAPKGIFPWFVPGADTFLGTFPLSNDTIALPPGDAVNLQIEPEVGVLADLQYDAGGRVSAIVPTAIAAFNDCSIRREGAPKISHKKNWGAESKGVSAVGLPVTELEPDGLTKNVRLASFLRRAGETHAYGIDSALPDYSYYGTQLLEWIIERLANQEGADDTPLEPVGRYLDDAGRPARALIGIGATRYTPLGETTFLDAGDESIVIVYDGSAATPDQVAEAVAEGYEGTLRGASVLRQLVIPASV